MYTNVLTATIGAESTGCVEEPTCLPICADCRYSQVFAVQPRTVCTHPTAALAGHVLCAAQVACMDFAAANDSSLSLSSFRASRPARSLGQL